VRIAAKVNVALIGAVASGILATFVVLNATIMPRFNEIEREVAHANHNRIIEALKSLDDKLVTATHDYAFWDQTYRFLQGEGIAEFISSNLEPEFKAVENLGVNALIFVRNDGTIVWGEAFDLETQNAIGGIVKEAVAFSFTTPGHAAGTLEAEHGLIRTTRGLALVAIAPALKSDGTGEPVGKVITVNLLDLGKVRVLTGLDFTIDAFGLSATTPDRPKATDAVSFEAEPERVVTTSVVNDVADKPLAVLKVISSRDVSRAGTMAIKSATMMMGLAGLAALGVLWLFLRTTVISRIETLKTHFATAGRSGTIELAGVSSAKDEISDLAQSFNVMADQVNHLRDAVADGAYMTGLSEWAAGTLHNVRNGLAPVTATTWQIEKLFDNAWVRNVETAVAELANPETDPARRGKLNTYLVGSASRIADLSQQGKTLAGQINSASKSVLDMVSEFERYAHHKTEFEVIDLLPLLNSVTSVAVDLRAKGIEVVMPTNTATVQANSIILRQVIANTIFNAVEAIESNTTAVPRQTGQITISIATHSDRDGMVRICIADNGEGIAAERLPTIFKRGVSSRHTRSGGLGLHWCANAVKMFDGAIFAESAGPGLGAVINIDIPQIEPLARKVA
jgi:two-component system, NtrC family, sensor kinase